MKLCRLCLFDRNDDHATRCRQCGGDMTPPDDDDDVADSAWFHYLNVPRVGTIELVPGRAFRIGREARNELVLPKASADLVATFFWTDGFDELTIREHGAAEPIKVEGIRIKGTRTLKGGEEVEIGALRLPYVKRATPVEGAIDASKASPGGGPEIKRVVQHAAMDGALEPNVRKFTPTPPAERKGSAARPADVALALEKSKATGVLRIKSDQGRGWVSVVAGAPRHAAFGGLSGPAALDAILRLPRGTCQMVQGTLGREEGERLSGSFSQRVPRAADPRATGPRPTAAHGARPPMPGGGLPGRPTGHPGARPPAPGARPPAPGARPPAPGARPPGAAPGRPVPRPSAGGPPQRPPGGPGRPPGGLGRPR